MLQGGIEEVRKKDEKTGSKSIPGDLAVPKNDFFRNSIVHWALIGMLFLNIASWIMLFIFVKPNDLPIVLHYNVYFGVDVIGDWRQVFLLPAIGLVFMIINGMLSYALYARRERIAAYVFLLTALLVQISVVIASASISMVNY